VPIRGYGNQQAQSERKILSLADIQIENEEVLRILIDGNRIERTFVSPTSVTANKDLERLLERQGLESCSIISADGFATNGTSAAGKIL